MLVTMLLFHAHGSNVNNEKKILHLSSSIEQEAWSYNRLPKAAMMTMVSLSAAKKPEDQLFETMDATDLNKTLKDLMDGLSVKVFRTYNASITLDRLLWEPSDSEVIDAKKADYDRANKEVRTRRRISYAFYGFTQPPVYGKMM